MDHTEPMESSEDSWPWLATVNILQFFKPVLLYITITQKSDVEWKAMRKVPQQSYKYKVARYDNLVLQRDRSLW